jgi:hypothetical protein
LASQQPPLPPPARQNVRVTFSITGAPVVKYSNKKHLMNCCSSG